MGTIFFKKSPDHLTLFRADNDKRIFIADQQNKRRHYYLILVSMENIEYKIYQKHTEKQPDSIFE